MFRKWDVGVWTGLGWLKIGTVGRQIANTVMNLWGSIKSRAFLHELQTGLLLKKDSAPWSK
jgi:hypothetical protein